MGKLSRKKKRSARIVRHVDHISLPVLEKREIEAARTRHEKSVEEKRARRAELRAAGNNPWPVKALDIYNLRKNAPADMRQITAQFNSDIFEIRKAEAAAASAVGAKKKVG